MKKIIFILGAVIITQSVIAQSPANNYSYGTEISGRRSNNNWYRINRGTGQQWSQDFSGWKFYPNNRSIFLRDASQFENETIADGEASLQVGNGTEDRLLKLNHNLTGRFMLSSPNSNHSRSGLITIWGLDDPTVSSLTASSKPGRNGNNQRRGGDNAITIFGRDAGENDTVQGSWRLVEGTYRAGPGGYSGIHVERSTGNFTIEGASFIASDLANRGVDGALFNSASGGVTINNVSGKSSDRFQGGSFSGDGTIQAGGNRGATYNRTAGAGLGVINSGATIISGGDFYGGGVVGGSDVTIDYTAFDTIDATVIGSGGAGALIEGTATISGGNFYGGDAVATVRVAGESAYGKATGGEGAVLGGTATISDAYFEAGRSKSVNILPVGLYDINVTNEPVRLPPSEAEGTAYAHGAAGLVLEGSATLENVTAIASRGSVAVANGTNSYATAAGGSGVRGEGATITINSGTYMGAEGGTARSANADAVADGGAGVFANGGSLTINGGTFYSADAGNAIGANTSALGGAGVWVQNANLTITDSFTNTFIDGHVFINESANVAINGGEITGDIVSFGSGTTALSISTNASYAGSFIQEQGTINVNLNNEQESRFFSDVYVGGTITFNNQKVITEENSSFVLGSEASSLNFTAGADLSRGTTISTGLGAVTAGNDLSLGDDSRIILGFNGLAGTMGSLDITGNLIASNSNGKVAISGASATPTGQVRVVTSTGVVLGGNTADDVVEVDTGWLTRNLPAQIDNGIVVDYEYRSLTNSSLSDLDTDLLLAIDSVITDSNKYSSSDFYSLNVLGESSGSKQVRYNISQQPDVSEASFQMSQQVNRQIAARGTEFRSMNGFASSKPSFSRAPMMGAAGPATDAQKTMQGWMRVYGSLASHDEDSNFTDYDSHGYGTVIGVDKSYGKMLVGVAGGYGRTDIDGGETYQADIDTYHGSIYATIGGESVFVDLAATYGLADSDEKNTSSSSSFESDIFSAYIGAGKKFEIGERFSITPEASMLASMYEQDAFDRSAFNQNIEMDDYDTDSYLGSLGINLATQHQIDWLNQGLAFIPEVRLHWLHEFNADPDEFSFAISGDRYNGAVRPRQEDLIRVGLGMDLWNWKYQSTKFELDYDGLFSDLYAEHIFSGKVTFRF